MLYLVGDFETVNDPNDCRVWASCLVDISDATVIQVTNNIDNTFAILKDCLRHDNVTLYYHNLKFDGQYIISWLYRNGFVYSEKLDCGKSFNTIITDANVFYEIKIKWKKGKNSKTITILDSIKIIPQPVRKIAKTFGLEMSKGEIDYNAYRPVGHKITAEERSYIERDCLIVAKALKKMFDEDLTKMTLGGNAISNYKELYGKERFKFTFPKIEPELDKFVRRAYKGGYVYCNPQHQNKILEVEGCTYDVNSLYPSVMYNKLLPYGLPITFKGKYKNNPNYPLYIQHIRCKFDLKPNHIPTIQLKGNSRFGDTEYLTTSGAEPVDLYLTNIDLKIFLENYDIRGAKPKYINGVMFKGTYNLFKDYIEYWADVKIQADKAGNEGLREIAKLMLNNLYGKFGQNPSGAVKIPIMGDDGVVEMVTEEQPDRPLIYTPMACFITAYAREITQRAFQQNYARCCYCDTDSIHLIGLEVPNIEIHDTTLGAWKLESQWKKAKFVRPKTYMEYITTDKKGTPLEEIWDEEKQEYKKPYIQVKCAGMPDEVKKLVTFENFKKGFTSEKGKLVPIRVKGGVILVERSYTMK